MALVEEINLRLTGKVDDRVYWEKDGEKISRAYFIPVQPGTGAQLTWWNIFKQGVLNWQAFTQGQKDIYNARAKRYRMSGFNLYMHDYLLSQP